ncbi:hypothetical protein KUV85_13925 [Nocardioides panacisoli]|uniref:hypothetical protein n=1 Tax=Nocardioides panacisoli TaxID=627624 RepID=UPI001C62698F|nr:hypothetical protein [Nocardioides panacisoli]QYJ03417.1 hypothetical protein KUV85_13925 [Nocardioides panacisoli]
METTDCPECALPADVEWRAVAPSTAGPVEHAKITCVQRHWFLLPLSSLAQAAARAEHREAA